MHAIVDGLRSAKPQVQIITGRIEESDYLEQPDEMRNGIALQR